MRMLVAGQRYCARVGCQEQESGLAATGSENQQLNDDKDRHQRVANASVPTHGPLLSSSLFLILWTGERFYVQIYDP